MNKTVYVNSYFKPIGKEISVKVSTGEKKKGFFGGEKDVTRNETQWQRTGWGPTAKSMGSFLLKTSKKQLPS